MAVRTSTIAEIKMLSLSTIIYNSGEGNSTQSGRQKELTTLADIQEALNDLRDNVANGAATLQNLSRFTNVFRTVGLARSVRIDTDYGTNNIYGIGAPTRPRPVPNNLSVNVTAERLQLDTRDLSHYMASPEYWYNDAIQREIGIDDILLYTYMLVRSKEECPGVPRSDIYALMPRSSSKVISTGDVMIAHSAQLVGFKYSFEELFQDLSNLVDDSITASVGFGGSNIPTITPGQPQ